MTVRLAQPSEIAAALRKELLPQAARIFPDLEPSVVRPAAKALAHRLSHGMLAKYAWDERAILVCADRFEELAEAFDEPALLSRKALRAVLVRECLHAVDHRLHDFPSTLRGLESAEAIQAFNAVIEGHAQFEARRICRKKGWSEGFEAYTSCIGRLLTEPDSLGGWLDQVTAAGIVWAHRDGERFIEALHAHDGEDAIARAFAAPPRTPDLIDHPEWYLDPESRPELSRDLEAGLAILLDYYPEVERDSELALDDSELSDAMKEAMKKIEEAERQLREDLERIREEHGFTEEEAPLPFDDDKVRRHETSTAAGAEMRAALALLPPAEVDHIVASVIANRIGVITRHDDDSVRITGGLYEFASEADAIYYTEAAARLFRIKDERLADGELLSAEYGDFEGRDWVGFVAIKEVDAVDEKITVHSLVAVRGDLVVEVSSGNEAITESELRDLVDEMTAAAWGVGS